MLLAPISFVEPLAGGKQFPDEGILLEPGDLLKNFLCAVTMMNIPIHEGYAINPPISREYSQLMPS